ncbi:MAG TPA: hypothetical protein VM818_14310 [Vicinamibacterales bacterium]|nr:hypothetical protein [Vicinamibacterales bacterium]
MSVLTPYLRQTDGLGQHARHGPATVEAVQTELEAMHSIVRALATIPDNSARARVMAWASAVFPVPEARTGASAAGAQLHAIPETASEIRGVDSFHSEGTPEIRAAWFTRPTPIADEVSKRAPITMPPAEPTTASSAPGQPAGKVASSPTSELLSVEDAEALSIKDVETLFDDTRPPQGQFPSSPYRPRLLRPRLVLRFRLWR